MKSSTTEQIHTLKVGENEYHGEDVKYGFFHSISELKTRDSPSRQDQMEDYRNILDICKMKKDLPNISLEDLSKLLHTIKA